jgi:pimeloyl-ACP methyl ester carboxylesterase
LWKRPLEVDAWVSRRALAKTGLERTTVAGPAGRITLFEGGSGPTLVLLHGAGDQAGTWARVAPALVGRFRLVVPDLAGHGDSAPRSGPNHLADVLAGVEAVLEARCAGERPTLVGNSLGAWVAFLVAHDRPDRVARVVAVNGGPIQGEDTGVNVLPASREEARRTMEALTGPRTPMVPGFVLDDVVRQARVGPLHRFAQTAGSMPQYLLDGRLGEVTVPVELVWGDADGLMTLDYARRVQAGLPDARLHRVAGCGHVPQRECPVEFVEVLLKALAKGGS